MKLIPAILGVLLASIGVMEAVPCPVCGGETVAVATQQDDPSKPSKNLSVWNRSICGNPLFGEGSWICPKDGYAYGSFMKRWELSLENRDGFALPLDRKIHDFPLPVSARIKSGIVYSQQFESLNAVTHGLLFWTTLDEAYFKQARQYAKEHGVALRIEPHRDQGQAIIRVSRTTKSTH